MKKDNPNDVEQRLIGLPRHRLSQARQQEIHQQLMNIVYQPKTSDVKTMQIRKVTARVASVAAVILFVFLCIPLINEAFNLNNNLNQHNAAKQKPTELNQAAAKEILYQYKQSVTTVIENADEDGLIHSFNSTEELRTHFEKEMSEEVVSLVLNNFFEEREGKLYTIRKAIPMWAGKEADFKLQKINEETYTVIQEQNMYIGYSKITSRLQWQNGKWFVAKVETDQNNSNLAIQNLAYDVVLALNNRDMKALLDLVHEEKGLLFSPYVYVEEDALVFEKDKVITLLENEKKYTWGRYDDSEKNIELTTTEYFNQILLKKEFETTDPLWTNRIEQRGHMVNNLEKVFPDSKMVAFCETATTENNQMDYRSLILIFEQNQKAEWKLVALVNDKLTN